MPMVPVVSQDAGSTPEVGAPGVAPMRNFAPEEIQQTGATIERAGESQMRSSQEVATHIQGMMDDASVKAAETKFIQSATDILHGDNGFMMKRGVDAVNGYDPAAQALSKAKQDTLESLENPVQKYQFNRVAQQHLVTFGAQMSQYRSQQRIEYSTAQAAARADSMRSMAQNSDIGSADQNRYIESGVQEVKNTLSFKGVPADSDEAKEAERKFRSQITADNVSRLMEDGKYEDAKTLLAEQMKAGNVEGDTGDRLRRAIRGNLTRTKNIEQADSIFAPYQDKQLQGTDLAAMLQKTAKIENPEEREHVQDMVRAKFNEIHSVQALEYRDNLNDVVNYKYKNNGSLKGVDPLKWGKLEPYDQAQLTKPTAVEDDLDTWYKFATDPKAATLENVNHDFARGLLSKGSYKTFVEKAVSLQNKPEYVQEASDMSGRISYFANQAGMNVYGQKNGAAASQTPDDKAQHGALTMAVQNEVDRVKAQNKGKITSDQVDQIIKKELTQHTLSLDIRRSPLSPLNVLGNTYTEQKQKRTFEIPTGATHVAPGNDGKMHWTDGSSDLGVVE